MIEKLLEALIARGAYRQAALVCWDALPDRPFARVLLPLALFDGFVATNFVGNEDSADPWCSRMLTLADPSWCAVQPGECGYPERELAETVRWLVREGKGSEADVLKRLRSTP